MEGYFIGGKREDVPVRKTESREPSRIYDVQRGKKLPLGEGRCH